MRRVVVTGMGIVSPIGNSKQEVTHSLMEQETGIVYLPEMADRGLGCCVYGAVRMPQMERALGKARQTMSDAARFAVFAALDALNDAGLQKEAVQNGRAAAVVSTWLGGINEVANTEQVVASGKNLLRAGGNGPVKLMGSTASGNLAAYLGIRGRTYSLSSACSSGIDSIGHAYELIKHGLQDLCICGASEEETWRNAGVFFSNLGALAVRSNDCPARACRPYNSDREGIVMAEGAGILVLEPLNQAMERGAHIYAEVVGYGTANDGNDMFQPSGEGLKEAISQALACARERDPEFMVEYVNSHAVGSKIGDVLEVSVTKEVLGAHSPWISSTKGLTGHAMAASGIHEAIYTLLMLENGFVAPTANLCDIDPQCAGVNHVQSVLRQPFKTAMNWSMGLGGTNSCIVFKKL